MNKKILIADDDKHILNSLEFLFADEDFEITSIGTVHGLLDCLKTAYFDLIIIDLNFHRDTTSGEEGLSAIANIRQGDDLTPIIVMTGWATIDIAVGALKAGANDFIQKPWNDEHFLSLVYSQLKRRDIEQKAHRLSEEVRLLTNENMPQSRKGIVAHSEEMQILLSTLEELAKSEINILLTGDNGTGKSMLANYVHNVSERSGNSLISVNMGAVPDSLFESEMFGHTKGSFTDAKENRVGRFEMAQNGTIFLDELANIPLTQQAKLLRVLEEKKFEPVGSNKTKEANVRVISATNANLNQLIEDRQFRQDLFYRLNGIEVRVPSLCERRDDIVPLATYFLTKFSAKYHKPIPKFSQSAKTELIGYSWPGNVRELAHLMERLLFTHKSNTIDTVGLAQNGPQVFRAPSAKPHLTLEEMEKNELLSRLAFFQGNVTETAKSLGLSRSGYYRRINKYDLD
jgi:DNA-binding NtrC family response regulator